MWIDGCMKAWIPPGESLVSVCMHASLLHILLFLFHSLSLFSNSWFLFPFHFRHYFFVFCIIVFSLPFQWYFLFFHTHFFLSLSFSLATDMRRGFSLFHLPPEWHKAIISMISVWLAGLFVCLSCLMNVFVCLLPGLLKKFRVTFFTKFLRVVGGPSDWQQGIRLCEGSGPESASWKPGNFHIIVRLSMEVWGKCSAFSHVFHVQIY